MDETGFLFHDLLIEVFHVHKKKNLTPWRGFAFGVDSGAGDCSGEVVLADGVCASAIYPVSNFSI
jgi:hypothetical protein